jgi:hypothetical protein
VTPLLDLGREHSQVQPSSCAQMEQWEPSANPSFLHCQIILLPHKSHPGSAWQSWEVPCYLWNDVCGSQTPPRPSSNFQTMFAALPFTIWLNPVSPGPASTFSCLCYASPAGKFPRYVCASEAEVGTHVYGRDTALGAWLPVPTGPWGDPCFPCSGLLLVSQCIILFLYSKCPATLGPVFLLSRDSFPST